MNEGFSSCSLLPWLDNKIDLNTVEEILPYGIKKTYSKDSYIISQGNIVDSVYYLATGKVKIITITINGKEKTYWHTLAGNIIGDTPYFHQLPSNASIIATENCVVYAFKKSLFERLLAEYPSLHKYITTTMANKIRVLINQIQTMSFCKPLVQVCKFLYFFALDFGKQTEKGLLIQQEITQAEIASINSLHRITVTKAMNQLKTANILDYKNKLLTIKDMDKLYELAFGECFQQ